MSAATGILCQTVKYFMSDGQSLFCFIFASCFITCLLVQKKENFVLSFLFITHNTSVCDHQLNLGWHQNIRSIKLVFHIALKNDFLL